MCWQGGACVWAHVRCGGEGAFDSLLAGAHHFAWLAQKQRMCIHVQAASVTHSPLASCCPRSAHLAVDRELDLLGIRRALRVEHHHEAVQHGAAAARVGVGAGARVGGQTLVIPALSLRPWVIIMNHGPLKGRYNRWHGPHLDDGRLGRYMSWGSSLPKLPLPGIIRF